MKASIIHGDSYHVLQTMSDNSIDAVVTDPPYGLGRKDPDPNKVMQSWINHGYHSIKRRGHMDREWDSFVPQPILWKEVLRVLKPGGHLLSFFGSRTIDWGVMSLRFAGFEIRDSLGWIFSKGLPKGVDVSKEFDRMAGVEREEVDITYNAYDSRKRDTSNHAIPAETSNSGRWGFTKSSLGRKLTLPATEEAKKWDGWNTRLRPGHEPILLARKPLSEKNVVENLRRWGVGAINIDATRIRGDETSHSHAKSSFLESYEAKKSGRWPMNIIHDGEPETLELFPEDVQRKSTSRFFYCAKPGKKERKDYNNHPTVKPIALMRHLCLLITPPHGTILDPFLGSGTTGIAAKLENFNFVGIEKEEEYVKIAEQRMQEATNSPTTK